MSDKGVCRTASATPGLLKTEYIWGEGGGGGRGRDCGDIEKSSPEHCH